MSNKAQSLGSASSAVAGILITAATNATPIVVTLNAGHGLKNGDRIGIANITGNTNANGDWTLGNVGATTATLLGSVGNGAFGGTALVAVLCDTTPFMKSHSCVVDINGVNVGVATAAIGTVVIEGTDNLANAFTDIKKGVLPLAFTTGQQLEIEVDLPKYLRMRVTAYTSGSFNALAFS